MGRGTLREVIGRIKRRNTGVAGAYRLVQSICRYKRNGPIINAHIVQLPIEKLIKHDASADYERVRVGSINPVAVVVVTATPLI